jgi:hypothetical protein
MHLKPAERRLKQQNASRNEKRTKGVQLTDWLECERYGAAWGNQRMLHDGSKLSSLFDSVV